MTPDEALARLKAIYHSPMLDDISAEIERLRRVEKAAQALADEGQEYDFDDIGLGRGAPNSYWEDLDEALDPEVDDDHP